LSINLNVKSHYSLLKSTISIEAIVDFSIKNNLKHASLIDIGNMYAFPEFYNLCLSKGIKPIFGMEINYRNSTLLLVCKNFQGYKNLIKVTSMINHKKEFELKELIEGLCIIKMSGNIEAKIYHFTCDEIAVQSSYYERNQDYKTFLILNKIGCHESSLINEHYLLTPAEIKNKFSDKQLTNLEHLISSIELVLPKFEANIYKYQTPKGIDNKVFFQGLCLEGLRERLNGNISKDYYDRLKSEMEVITSMNFHNYFLVVWDFIKWAKNNSIVVGPGRGSSGGSLVCYALNIVDVDPIKYDLLFERFLNKDRVSMPDIDIDFMDTRRNEVVNYIFEKYTDSKVAHIVTFQKMKAKMAIRDVGRVLGIDLKIIDNISKAIPLIYDEDIESAIKNIDFLNQQSQIHKDLFEHARLLIGCPRQVGIHAAGIVISNDDLSEVIPVQSSDSCSNLTQYSMDHLERFGLIKIDLLGLRNLTIIDDILKLIATSERKKVILEKIPLYDKKTMKNLSEGKTLGIFQLESPGMTSVIKRMGVHEIEDIVATSSLYRPGPKENIGLFIKRRNGQEPIHYISNDCETILKKTYGIIVYQEQVMQIVQKVANFSLARADILRRAISKKDHLKMMQLKKEFIDGAIENNYKSQEAQQIFDYIYNFADYGFNRSHALSYSIIGYWTAFLKTHFPSQFFSVLMTSSASDVAKIANYCEEARSLGIEINGIDINNSRDYFKMWENNRLYFPITFIKGLGTVIYQKIHEDIKNNGHYIGILQTLCRLVNCGISDKVIEQLIMCGAFSSFGYSMKSLVSLMPNIDNYAKISKQNPQYLDVIKFDNEPEYDNNYIADKQFELMNMTFIVTQESNKPREIVFNGQMVNQRNYVLKSGVNMVTLTAKMNDNKIQIVAFLKDLTILDSYIKDKYINNLPIVLQEDGKYKAKI
jgi:DNA polymerase-3 subunit alpha